MHRNEKALLRRIFSINLTEQLKLLRFCFYTVCRRAAYHLPFFILPATSIPEKSKITAPAEIHRGESTHTQRHFITLNSFNSTSAAVRTDTMPSPLCVALSFITDLLVKASGLCFFERCFANGHSTWQPPHSTAVKPVRSGETRLCGETFTAFSRGFHAINTRSSVSGAGSMESFAVSV